MKKTIAGIQFLRGIAALGVVVFHVSSMAAFPKYFGQALVPQFLVFGSLGVDVFFIISGFIISMVTLNGSLEPTMSAAKFFIKRFSRIVPLMWLAILSYAVLRLGSGIAITPITYIRAATLFPAFSVEPNVIWTLRHEMLFYLTFALTFMGPRYLRFALPLWFAAPIIVWLTSGTPDSSADLGRELVRIIASPVNLQFMLGFGLGVFWLKNKDIRQIRTPINPLLILAIAFVALMGVEFLLKMQPHDTVLQAALTGLLALPIVALAVYVECPDGLTTRFGNLLGAASYSIYLFHEHAASALLRVWSRFARGTPIVVAVIGIVILATLIGVLIHKYVEKRLVKATQRMLERCGRHLGGSPDTHSDRPAS